jgi:hypothetical protein
VKNDYDRPTTGAANQLIGRAPLPADAREVLVTNLDDTVLLGCVGLAADGLDTADATLVSIVLDMSGSMESHRQTVIDAYNAMMTALAGAKAAGSILVSTWAFSDTATLLSSYEAAPRKPKLDKALYAPNGMTALYDAVLAAMTGLVTYGQRLWDEGVPTRRVLFVLSDGGDNSSKAKAHEVRTAARALARDEAYTLAYAGFGSTDLQQQADAIGFPNVVVTGASESELRRVFRQVSQSVLRVSQGTQPSAGGFF